MRSIRSKLWLSMMALVAIVLLLLWLLQIVFLERFYAHFRVADIKQKVAVISQLIIDGRQSAAIEELDRLALTQGITIEWLDQQAGVIYRSAADAAGQMPMMRNMVWSDLYQRALLGEKIELTLSHHRFNNKYTVIGVPINDASGNIKGGLLASIPMAAVAETAAILKRQLVYITLILLLVTSLLSFWLAKGFIKPILHIREVAVAMAGGDFSARAESTSSDEISMLAGAINFLGEELAKIEQLRRDLVANVSHELRTPLSIIRGYAETIRDITGDRPAEREKQLAIIIEETERLADMVNNTLHLAQLQSGTPDLKLATITVQELLEGAVKQHSLIAEQAGVTLTLVGDVRATVEADPAKIAQVIGNLLQNSLQHTSSGGTIEVRARAKEQAVHISVVDTGSGIPATDLPYVWDEYYQSTHSRGRERVGTGLGLAIVKNILDAHDANYGIDSILGAGTTIWFELKRAQ